MARLLTGFISENDCIGDSLDAPGGINPNFLVLDEAVQSLSATSNSVIATNNTQNTLITNLRTDVNSVSGQVYATGSVLQTVITMQVPPNITAGATVATTGLTPITITRKRNNSRLLFELTGGRFAVSATGHNTWTYVSENGGAYTHYNGSPATTTNSQQFIYSNSAVQGPHCIRVFYTPSSSVNTVSFLPFTQRWSTTNSTWNTADASGTIPITMTATEIA